MLYSTATLMAALAASVSAYSPTGRTFAVNHFYGKGPLTSGRMDPIVSPGVASGHVHTIQGGNKFALTMGDDDLLSSTCTSSLVKNDKSNYWTPSLYFQDPNDGSLTSVDMFYMNVYYFFEATTDKIEAFQPGHRMVVGSPALRTPPATGGLSILDLSDGTPQPVQWTCPRSNTNEPLYPTNSDGLHGVGIQDPGNGGAGVGFPDQNCDGYASPLRADIHFPSCYNPAAGLDNYKENMQFPTNGNCPTGWIHTPHLFYEVYWNTPLFADKWTPGQGKQPFVLANGDPTGYSLHADFISGWDVDTLQQIIDNCDAGDAGMDKCPGLMGGLNDPSTSCNIDDAINEVIFGTMSQLPGNNPIGQWGVNAAAPPPASAPAATPTTAAAAPATTSAGVPVKSSTPATVQPVEPTTSPMTTPAADPPTSSVASATSTKPTGAVLIQTDTVLPVESSSAAALPTGGSDSTTFLTAYSSSTASIFTTVSAHGATPTVAASASGEASSPAEGSTPASSVPAASAPAASSSAASSSAGASNIPGWGYFGCYSDKLGNGLRVLSGITFANIGNHQVTNTKCTAYCGAQGYSLAGTEYGGQCFCGNELVGSSAVDESMCDMPCEGDDTETCGGSLTLSVYQKSSTTRRRSHRHAHMHARNVKF